MDQINGGFKKGASDVYCPTCGNSDSGEISYQLFATMFGEYKGSDAKYRCCKCNRYFELTGTFNSRGHVYDLGSAD